MKQTSYLLISLLFISFLYSCTPSPSEMIVGKWKITDIKTSEEIPEDQKEMYDQIMKDLKSSTALEFKNDGTFDKTISEEVGSGKWSISEDVKTLTMTDENGKNEPATILELTENSLITVNELDKTKNTITWGKVK